MDLVFSFISIYSVLGILEELSTLSLTLWANFSFSTLGHIISSPEDRSAESYISTVHGVMGSALHIFALYLPLTSHISLGFYLQTCDEALLS